MSDSGSDNEIRCNACGFEASYVPEGMLPCERCSDVHYCSIHCLQWDWKSGGHDKVCSGQRKQSGSNEAAIQPAQTGKAKKAPTDAQEEDSGSVEWVEEEVSASSDDEATMVSMEVGQVFKQESQPAAAAARQSDQKAKAENSSSSKGSLGSYLESSSPTKAQKRSTPAPPPPPVPITLTEDKPSQEEGILEDSIQQDVLFGGDGSDHETQDEALTCISEEDSKHFQGEPDHEGSWRRREHFTEKSAAKPALGTLGITEEVDSEGESVDFFDNKQGSSAASEGDFYQGEYQNSDDESSTTSGSDYTPGENEDEEMEMLENVDMYMEAAAATPSKRAATDDKGNADSKRAKEQIKAAPVVVVSSEKGGEKQVEATNQENMAKRSSYKDFREAYSAGDAEAVETSSSLKKFRELYVAEKAIPEDEETLMSIRSIEKEMETLPADSNEDAIAAKKEALKKSINTALRDLEKIHGEEAAQAIFLRLTQNLDGIDTQMLSKELSEGNGSPSSNNSSGSGNKSGSERNEDSGSENPRSVEPTISPIEPSAASVDTIRTVSTSGADTENNSTTLANKEERTSAIPRYMQYRSSLSSPDRASKMPSESSPQVSEAVTPDDGISSTSLPSNESRPSSIPRYMQYRSALAKDPSEGSSASGVEAKGFDADTAAGVPVVTEIDQEDSNQGAESTEIPRYMKYRDSLRNNSSNSSKLTDVSVLRSSSVDPLVADTATSGNNNQDTELPDSQSTFIPRFMQYRAAFNQETAQSEPSTQAQAVSKSGDGEEAEGGFNTSTGDVVSINQADTTSMPRYLQYHNTLAKKTGPVVASSERSGVGDADADAETDLPLEERSDKNTAGIVAAAAVGSIAVAAATAAIVSASGGGKSGAPVSAMNEPTVATMPRYMQYRNTLSSKSVPLQSDTDTVDVPITVRNEAAPLTSVSAETKDGLSDSDMKDSAPSSTPRYMQYRDTLAKNTAMKETAVEGNVTVPGASISPDDTGVSPAPINQADASSMPRYMQYRNSLAKKAGPDVVFSESSSPGDANSEPPAEGGPNKNTAGIVAAAAVGSIAASAAGTAAVKSPSDDFKNEPTASTMPRYMQYRSSLAAGTGSKVPPSEMDLSQSGNLEDPSMSESDSSMESQPEISVPDDLAKRNSRHLADSESSESEEGVEEEEDPDEDASMTEAGVTAAVLSSAAIAASSASAEPVPGPNISQDEARAIQDLNRQRIAATISRATTQGNVKPGPKTSPDDEPPTQDVDRQQIAPAIATAAVLTTATAVTAVAAQSNIEPSPVTSSDDAHGVQDLNRQRIAATISKAMSQYKGKKEASTLQKTPEQEKPAPLQEQTRNVADKQVADTAAAASPPPPVVSRPASVSSPTLPPQPSKAAAVPAVAADSEGNNEKSQDLTQSAPQKRRRYILFGALILLLIVAPLAIGLGVTQRNKDAPLPPPPSEGTGTSAPSSLIVTSAPSPLLRTKAPAASPPAGSPTVISEPPMGPSPTGAANPTREPAKAELFELLSSVSSDNGTKIETPGTPQNDAFNWLASDPNVTALPDERLIQRYSLATFYYSTNGTSWTSSEGWLSEEDECTWFTRSTRIPVCDESGVFQNLDLGFNEVGGTLVAELALLSNLLRLELSGGTTQRISGPIPADLGSLTRLVSFSVFGNALTGNIPFELGALTSLESMNVAFNRLEGSLPKAFEAMTSLVELDCGLNFLTGSIPTALSNLPSLERLLLNNNEMNGNLQVGGLSKLRELNVAGNGFTSLDSSIGNLSNLQTLQLNNNSLKGPIPKNIGNLISLVTLEMSRNELTGQIPTQIGMLSNLRNLHLSSNSLEGTIPTQIGMLGRLLNLLVQSNNLTGSIPDEISQLGRLTTIRLEDNSIQGSLPTIVCDAFTVTRPIFYLDCGGDSPEVTCPAGSECCTFCCSEAGGCQCELEGTSSEFLCG